MWDFINSASLIRYLIVWRIKSSLVWSPRSLSAEISLVLGATIAERLPTREAHPWRKALAAWEGEAELRQRFRAIPEASWPIETVLFTYPGKRTYGRDELIFWELKLIGRDADHGRFLEVILPAMEDAATDAGRQWRQLSSFWGQFEIHAIFAARGDRWEPIVREGRLDLHYRPTPTQWAEGLKFTPAEAEGDAGRPAAFQRLVWLTPFDLRPKLAGGAVKRSQRRRRPSPLQAPTLEQLLESLIERLGAFLPGRRNTPADVWNSLSDADRSAWQAALEQAAQSPPSQPSLQPPPRYWPGLAIGRQDFPAIPASLLPYLNLAAILHLGRQTHFGCGTFLILNKRT